MGYQNVRPWQALTAREEEVLWLMAEGLANKQIADRLGISEHTAKFHVRNCCVKLGTTNRTKAAVQFVLMRSAVGRARLLPEAQQTLLA